MAFSDGRNALYVGISSDSTAGCEFGRNFQARCPFPAWKCHVTDLSMRTRQTVGVRWRPFAFWFYKKKKVENNGFAWVIWGMFCILHSSRTTTAKKTHLTSLKCIRFGPIGWLRFCFEKKLFDQRRHSIRVCGGKFTKKQQMSAYLIWETFSVFSPESGEAFTILQHSTLIKFREQLDFIVSTF